MKKPFYDEAHIKVTLLEWFLCTHKNRNSTNEVEQLKSSNDQINTYPAGRDEPYVSETRHLTDG